MVLEPSALQQKGIGIAGVDHSRYQAQATV